MQFWKRLQDIKDIFMVGVKFVLGEGDSVSFWINKWYEYEQLSLSFPRTYELTKNKMDR